MRALTLCVLILAGLCLASCQNESVLDSLIPDDARPVTELAVESLAARDLEQLRPAFPPSATPEQVTQLETEVFPLIPDVEFDAPRLLGAHATMSASTSQGTSQRLELVYLLPHETESLRLELLFVKADDNAWYLTWLNVLEAANHPPLSLEWSSNSAARNLALVLPMTCLTFILVTFIASFRFNRIKRRILWSVFILCAYPVFAFNWSTETWQLIAPAVRVTESGTVFNLISLTLLGSGFEDFSPLEPATIQTGIPLGALLFWYRVVRGGPTRKDDEEIRLP